jgi:rare lipoprotein A (peptidoglycan hydrolase)
MIAQAAAVMRHPRALYLPPRAAVRSAPAFRRPAITRNAVRHRKAMSACTLAAGVFALAAATLAIMDYQEGRQDADAIEPVRNETIVLRQEQQTYTQAEQAEVSNDQEDGEEAVPSNYPRVVHTVRFLNPDAAQSIGTKGQRVSKDGRTYGVGKPYTVHGRTFVPTDNPTYRAEGIASWYGPDFHGRLTANGERYDMHGISAAHPTMPLPSYARVTDLDNGRSIIVRVNNRGPFAHNRIMDLSVGAARALDFYSKGTARVRVEFVGRAPIEGGDDQMLLATLRAGAPAPAPSQVMVASAKPFLAKLGDGKERRSPTEH